MAQESKFTQFLHKLHLVEYVDEGEEQEEPIRRAPASRENRSSSSVYESRYDSSRGIKRPASPRAESGTRPAKHGKSRSGTAIARVVNSGSNVPANKPDTMVYYLSTLSECAEVIKGIISGTSALISFDNVDERTIQRIIDTLSGAAFALNAKVRKITDETYLIAPESVNVNMSRRIERRY